MPIVSGRLSAAALILAALLCACGGGGSEPGPSPTATPSPQPAPRPYVPEEEPTPGIPTGRVTTQIKVTCSLSIVDAVISASYSANVAGRDSTLRRVRLMLNNKLADDSGDIYVTSFEKEVQLHVASGSNYSLMILYTATNATGPQFLNIVTCPKSPGAGA
jgi:hypothetical protein